MKLNNQHKKIIERTAKKLWRKDKGRRYASYGAAYAITKIKFIRQTY